MTTSPEPGLDLPPLVEVLNRHGVEHLVVAGSAGHPPQSDPCHQGSRLSADTTVENLERLGAMRGLDARLRVAGLSDIAAKQLPTNLTPPRSGSCRSQRGIPTPLDVLADIPNRLGDGLR